MINVVLVHSMFNNTKVLNHPLEYNIFPDCQLGRKFSIAMLSDSSDSESEGDLQRLREAVDNDKLKESMFVVNKPSDNDVLHSLKENIDESLIDASVNPEVSSHLGESIKYILKTNSNRCIRNDRHIGSSLPSLRRDKHEVETNNVIPELDVTPQFQQFVGKKLDIFLEQLIETHYSEYERPRGLKSPNVKLLNRSTSYIVEHEHKERIVKQARPHLLAHKAVSPSLEDMSSCAVSGEFVMSKVEVKSWVNKFPNRVEEGIERIKKKKKKVKKKKKSDVAVQEKNTQAL